MAEPVLSPSPLNSEPDASLLMLHIKLRHRLEENISSRHPWKQLLGTAPVDTRGLVLQALGAYVQLWNRSEQSRMPDGRQGCAYADARVVDLFNAAEQDLEKGLSFIREVEKGSHLKADAVLKFRPDAIKALCELCCSSIDELQSKASQVDGKGEGDEEAKDVEDDEDEDAEKLDHEKTTNVIYDRCQPQDLEAAQGLIGTVYRNIEPQFKTRLQLLVHQRKTKASSK
jgi:hypothetical protein